MKVSCQTPKQATADAYVVGVVTKDDKRSAPGLATIGEGKHPHAKWLLDNEASGLAFGQVQSVPGMKLEAAIVLVGIGDGELTQEKAGTCMSAALRHIKNMGFHKAATTLVHDIKGEDSNIVQGLVHGAIMGDLTFNQWKGDQKKPKAKIDSLTLLHDKPASIRKAAKEAAIIGEAVNDARLLANTPGNIATPKWMATQARSRGRKHGFSVSVKGRTQLRKEGFNALCGVAQGSVNEEQLITMTYTPAKVTKNTKTLVLVGKGVTFDSGGISLKPGQGMWDMKYDKCGACNVIALMPAIAQLKPNHKVIGITPCVENMPGGKAQRPGDIIAAKDGTTIEILNTDAEGRLILADAVTHARSFKPDWILEQSTLTGACEYAVGKTYVAAMSKDDEFVDSIVAAAKKAGDKAWKLPQGEEFDDGNKGTYADIQNISLKVKAGSSIGGAFVAHFAKDTKFAHLDIASKAWVEGMDYFPKGPTGAGLRIAVQRVLDE